VHELAGAFLFELGEEPRLGRQVLIPDQVRLHVEVATLLADVFHILLVIAERILVVDGAASGGELADLHEEGHAAKRRVQEFVLPGHQ
jgi:hypothetical protein